MKPPHHGKVSFNRGGATTYQQAPLESSPPPLPQSKRHRGGQNSFKRRSDDSNSRRGFNSYNIAQFNNSGNQDSDLQRNSTTNTTRRVVISASVGKKIVLQFKDSNSTTGRDVSALPGQLGKTDKRSEYFANSQGISNSVPLQTKAKKGTKGNKLFNSREGNNLIRSGKSLE